MTDQEINERLALAIGWPGTYTLHDGTVYVHSDPKDWFRFGGLKIAGREFDYRDPAVIWPIAEQYNCFPYALRDDKRQLTGQWNAWSSRGIDVQADSAAKAVALSVITARFKP